MSTCPSLNSYSCLIQYTSILAWWNVCYFENWEIFKLCFTVVITLPAIWSSCGIATSAFFLTINPHNVSISLSSPLPLSQKNEPHFDEDRNSISSWEGGYRKMLTLITIYIKHGTNNKTRQHSWQSPIQHRQIETYIRSRSLYHNFIQHNSVTLRQFIQLIS